jgi:hypothetical protein
VDPFWDGGKSEAHRRTSSMARCGRPEGTAVGGGVRGGGRQLAVHGGRTRQRGARGVVEAVREGPKPAVHGGLVMASKAA